MGAKGVYTKENLLSPEDIDALKKAPLHSDERLIVYGLLYTGMRVGEFIHLRKEWIDWDRAIIKIPAEQKCNCYDCMRERKKRKPNKKTGLIPPSKPKGVWHPKTKAAVRTIPLMPELFPIFDVLKDYFSKSETVMETIQNRGEAWYLVNGAKKKAHITHKMFPHAFRGTYATQLASAGMDAFSITSALGWEDIAIAMVYIKLSGEQLKSVYTQKMKAF